MVDADGISFDVGGIGLVILDVNLKESMLSCVLCLCGLRWERVDESGMEAAAAVTAGVAIEESEVVRVEESAMAMAASAAGTVAIAKLDPFDMVLEREEIVIVFAFFHAMS